MAKKLKIWNGSGCGSEYINGHLYVAAYSQKQAVEVINQACSSNVTISHFKNYFSEGSWGNDMNHIIPTEPCVYAAKHFRDKPTKIL